MKRTFTQFLTLTMIVCCSLLLTANTSNAFAGKVNAPSTSVTTNTTPNVMSAFEFAVPVAPLTVSAVAVSPTCYGGSNGSIDVTVAGGTAPYTYAWSNGATTQDLAAVASGSYTVTVTDAAGVIKTKTVNVISAVIIQGYIDCSKVCFGSCNGIADLTILNGTGPFTYKWSNNATTEDLTNLCAGVYSVTVKDANGCAKIISTQVQSYSQIVLTAVKTDLNCSGVCIGAIDLSVSGGTAPYVYAWSNGAITQDLSGLCAGPYSVTVTDFNGCAKVKSLSILQPVALGLSIVPNSIPCFGVCIGSVNATVTGGTAPYNFAWSNGATTEDLSGVCAGAYTLTVTDAKGCVKISSTNINQPAYPLNATAIATDVNCNTTCSGTINISVTGGTAPYSYLWNNGSTDEDRSGLCLGTYCVTITDANQCVTTKCATVNQTIPPTITLTPAQLVCNNICTGSVDLNVISENAPFTYQWNNGATTEDVTGLCAGEYCVTVSDVNGCTAGGCITITQPSSLILTPDHTDNPCFGNCVGTASVTTTGGTAPYSYVWENGSTENNINGLCSGEYCVTVYDAHQCSTSVCISVSNALVLNAEINSSNTSCFNACNGTASVSPFGGTAPYSYIWNNGSTNASVNGLCAGEYCVTVYDAHQCSVVKCVTVSQPVYLQSYINCTHLLCNNVCNGIADLSVVGGTAPFTFVWNNGATSEDISGLCAGLYCVTVTDANGCSSVACQIVSEPTELAATSSSTDVNCFNACNGTASVSANGGTAPYSYSWNNGNTNSSVSALCAGSYCVTVYDAHQCSVVKCVTVSQPTELTATAASTDVNCFNACNGTASISANGGTAPYTYVWSNGNTNSSLSALCAGSYCVTVYDAHQCSVVKCVTVSQPTELTATASSTDVNCFNACNGTASVSANGGTAPYSYTWNNGNTNSSVSSLCAGSYCVTVYDAHQCSVVKCVTVSQPTLLAATTSQTNNNCFQSCNGTASVNATGGTTPYSYTWSNGNSNASMSGLCAGSYCVTVYDAHQCSIVKCVTISEPTQLNAIIVGADATNGIYPNCNGSANLTVSGGTAPYTYIWSNGAITEDLSGLCPGTYSVTVMDAHQCPKVAVVTIYLNHICNIGITGYILNIGCNANCNGSINITVSNATSPTYHWSNGATTEDVNGLCAGSYSVTVTDAYLCSASQTFTVNQNAPIVITITSANTTNCSGCCNGTASASATGGVAPYTYHWSTGSNNANTTGLCAGTYSVTVTDAAGCTKISSVCIVCVPPCVLTLTGVVTNVSCNGGNNGAIDLTVSGGSSYTYHWNNNASTQDISGLAAGSYSVTVTSAGGCSGVKSFTLCQPAAICASVVGYNTCYGTCAGSADLTVSGGTAPYSYTWSNGAITQDLSGLCAGTYYVTVKDANLCSIVKSVCITQNSQIVVSITSANTTNCSGCCNGTASASATGGTAPYAYHWSTGANCANISSLCAGTYSVTVTDAAGCTKTGSVCIVCVPPCNLTLSGVVTNVSCNGGNNGSIDFTVTGGSSYTYHWNTNASTQDISGLAAGSYSVTVTSAGGCSGVKSFTVCQPSAICASIVGYNTCYNVCAGSADLSVSGGTAPYTYKWSTNAITQDISGLCAGTYYVTVKDANLCSVVKSVCITQNSQIIVTITSTNTTNCSGCCNGTANASATGGTAPYTYHWSTGANCANISSLCAGTYSVTVTDAAGCTKTGSVCIACVPPCILTLTGVVTNVSCNSGSNGAIDLSVSGGTAPYTYHWNNGATTQDRSALCAGTYSVTVTSAAGCSGTASFCVSQPTAICATICATNTCVGQCTGTADLTVSGGTAPYTYHWNSGASTQDRTCLSAGTYSVTVTDSKQCSIVKSVTICAVSCGCKTEETPSLTLTSTTNTELNMNIYPNPLNTQTTFEFVASQDVTGTLELYSVTGALITEIYRGELKAGEKYTFSYNAEKLAAGMYFARLATNNGTVIQNIMKMQ